MKSRSPVPAVDSNPFLLWGSLAWKTMEMSTAAVQVIALRTSRMASAGINPSAEDRLEIDMMSSEKVDAFTRAGQAIAVGVTPMVAGMAGQAFRSGMDVYNAATRLATSRSLPQTMHRQQELAQTLLRHAPSAQPGATATARLAHRALDPVHSTATANARRLTKKS